MSLLILDVGTSSMRGILYSEEADPLFLHRQTYLPRFIDDRHVEVDPALWRDSLYTILARCEEYAREQGLTIGSITLTSLRSATLAVDRDGAPLLPTIMWQDKRNDHICHRLTPHRNWILQKTGGAPNTTFSGSKMAWIREERPEVYGAAHKILTVADYLLFLLTGDFVTDHTYGSRSSLMDLRTRRWDPELLDLFGIAPEKLCELRPVGSMVGKTTALLAERTGVSRGIPVYSAGGDQQCSALGQGAHRSGALSITTGTGAYLAAHSEEAPERITGEILCSVSAVPGRYIYESSILACCSVYDWFCRSFYAGDLSAMDREVVQSPPGANGCLLIPHFQGRGTPDWNSSALGVFHGLSLSTARADMARAVLEGIALEVAQNVRAIAAQGGEMDTAVAGGGLTALPLFNQILSDCTGLTVTKYRSKESTAIGAWASTAVESGLYQDYADALAAARRKDHVDVYRPNAGLVPLYSELGKKTTSLYDRIFKPGG